MSPPAPPRARLIVAGAALVIFLALAAGPAWSAPVDAVVGLGAAGVILFGAALAFAQARLVPWALGCLAAEFMIWLSVRELQLTALAAVYGAGLLLAAELADWSFELGLPSRDDPGLKRRHALTIGGLVAASAVIGLVAAVAAQAPAGGGLVLAAAGIGAVVTLFVALAVLTRRAE